MTEEAYSRVGRWRAAIVALAALCPVFAGQRPPATASVGVAKQLFADDFLVKRSEHVTRSVHPATKYAGNPVLKPEKPWEQTTAYLYGSVMRSPAGLFRMWYQIWENPCAREAGHPGYRILYATSRDGIRWDRPELGLYKDNGQDTNIVETRHIPSIIEDARETDPSRRYRMFCYAKGGYHVLFSPDGLRWTPYAKNPVLPGGDVAPTVYDEQSGQYLSFAKTHPVVLGRTRRSVGLSVSSDFVHWSPTETILVNDAEDDAWAKAHGYSWREFYGMSGFPYDGVYFGFVWVFNVWGRVPGGTSDGTFDVELTYSRDGRHWQRFSGRKPVVPRTPSASLQPSITVAGTPPPDDGKPRPFDCGMIVTANRPLIVGDEIWLYYGGLDCTHGCKWYGEPENGHRKHGGAIGLAKWRLDGFVSLDAGAREGTIETRPIIFGGNELVLNADARRGEIRVEILDAAGKVLARSERIAGDGVRQVAGWQDGAGLTRLAGKPVRLRFRMRQAELYSFQFREARHGS